MASCAKGERKFFAPTTLLRDASGADRYLTHKFDLHLRRMNRRHGNWAVPTTMTTAFETRARELNLIAATYFDSEDLPRWCEDNREKCYIPEWLLKAWGL